MTATQILRGAVKLFSLDFLVCVYLSYRPKTVPTFALALPKSICPWFLEESFA